MGNSHDRGQELDCVVAALLAMTASARELLLQQASACQTTRQPSPLLPEQPPLFAVPVPRLFGLALIVQLLSAGERDFDFRPALFVEVNF